MTRRPAAVALFALGLDPASATPLTRQLYDAIREAILAGRLRAGARLPSTRALAVELGHSRNTVLAAFEQLVTEGYLESRAGAGTVVTRMPPDSLLRARPETAGATRAGRRRAVSRRGARILAYRVRRPGDPARPRPFRPGLPGFDAFPTELWARLVARRWRRAPSQLLDYGEATGYSPLRDTATRASAPPRSAPP